GLSGAEPEDDCKGKWVSASPETIAAFSAVGYYFAQSLRRELQTPVGIINTSVGGTPSEAWTSREALATDPDLKATVDRLDTLAKEYPAAEIAHGKAMNEWIAKNHRQDKPAADPAAFTAVPAEGWTSVTLPGIVSGKDLPPAGAIWLRKDIPVAAATARQPLRIDLGPINGTVSLYWDGQPFPVEPMAAPGAPVFCALPAAVVTEGNHALAVRVFTPLAPVQLAREPKAGTLSMAGPWLAKAEFALPALPPAETAALPKPPAKPPTSQRFPGTLFNAMIHPIIPYAIHGVIWYQGEANANRGYQYRTAFPLLITDWRKRWSRGDFPFLFCQLASYSNKPAVPGESAWAELREAQSLALKLPQTGQAVLIDIGEALDIHPRNKKDAGDRLARIALDRSHGKSIPFSGPVFDAMKIENGRVRLTFTHAEGGLAAKPLPPTYDLKSSASQTAPLVRNSPGAELEGFAICGEDRKWVWADAKIEGKSVVVWSDKVPQPAAVRYAWANNPTCNLVNSSGLPASPFRTDDFPASTKDVKF
ncbi:MAG: sialate O-acetylesterase, partial [Verrucomicrobiota bacterium]